MEWKNAINAMQKKSKEEQLKILYTKWGEELAAQPQKLPRAEYPRPQMRRTDYHSLNGYWEYAILKKGGLPARKPPAFSGADPGSLFSRGCALRLTPDKCAKYQAAASRPGAVVSKKACHAQGKSSPFPLPAAFWRRGSGSKGLPKWTALHDSSGRLPSLYH